MNFWITVIAIAIVVGLAASLIIVYSSIVMASAADEVDEMLHQKWVDSNFPERLLREDDDQSD